ncbi:MAG: glycosyltransferase family 9 protein [Thermodesulfobacteriota bacterium]
MTPATAAQGPDGRAPAVVLRSGGLGDFILTLPLLAALGRRHRQLTLVTRRSYWDLVAGTGLAHRFVDIDSALVASLLAGPTPELTRLLQGADLYSFLPDGDGGLARGAAACGARGFWSLPSRPRTPPHVVQQMLAACGLAATGDEPTAALLDRGPGAGPGRLWLHPGSGSPAKNAPPAQFATRARAWLAAGGPGLIVSFGEADLDLVPVFRDLLAGLPAEMVVMPALSELRQRLAAEAVAYLGNDSGVSHLAAACGIPTEVFFTTTDPAIWAPVGPQVRITRLATAG